MYAHLCHHCFTPPVGVWNNAPIPSLMTSFAWFTLFFIVCPSSLIYFPLTMTSVYQEISLSADSMVCLVPRPRTISSCQLICLPTLSKTSITEVVFASRGILMFGPRDLYVSFTNRVSLASLQNFKVPAHLGFEHNLFTGLVNGIPSVRFA